jgi:type IV pilus assembly protein PilX
MLTSQPPRFLSGAPQKQAGVVLMIALIMLVAMTLAGIALVRSVDTTNIIAGNLAFKQSATNSGDIGTEAALVWLSTAAVATDKTVLWNTIANAKFYSPFRADPGPNVTWDAYWKGTLDPGGFVEPAVPVADQAGNTVQYTIHRLCSATGGPTVVGTGCARAQASGVDTQSDKGGEVSLPLDATSPVYYRITTRIAGPRNTVSYVQSIVSR